MFGGFIFGTALLIPCRHSLAAETRAARRLIKAASALLPHTLTVFFFGASSKKF